MPESVRDRPTKAHEYLFLFAKSQRYFYDADAIMEPWADGRAGANGARSMPYALRSGRRDFESFERGTGTLATGPRTQGRNKRSVWTLAPKPYKGAHFAVMPEGLIEPCVLAGCLEGGIVLDPFAGAGTVGLVALRHNRMFLGIDQSEEYVKMAKNRIYKELGQESTV
jgi:DNA modification methylase